MTIFFKLRNLLDAQLHPRRWFLFVLLFMLVRGLLVLCVLPPLEGWDEFQHMGYIDYLDRHHQTPVIGEARLDNAFTHVIAAYPQTPRARSYGARSYADYWRGAAPPNRALPPAGILLYEAQHPPGYYWLVLPIYHAMGGLSHFLAVLFTLRILDLLLTITAAAFFMASFRLLLGEGVTWRWASALLAVHPLFLLTGDRVANDALSLLAAGLALYLTARLLPLMRGERPWTWRIPILLGLTLGLTVWTKPTVLALLPVLVLPPLFVGLRQPAAAPMARRIGAIAIVLALFAVISAPFFLRNENLYHAAVPIVEAVTGGNTKTSADFLAAARHIDWSFHLRQWWLAGSLWVGGWSLLELRYSLRFFQFEPLLIVGLLLAAIRALRSLSRTSTDRPASIFWIALLAFASFSAALAMHAVKTFAYLGIVATAPWYAAAAWPLELAAIAAGFAFFKNRWIGRILTILLIAVCLRAEWEGTLTTMLRRYADTRDFHLSLARLASLRPALFGTPTLYTLAALYVVMAVFLVLTLLATRDTPAPLTSADDASAPRSAPHSRTSPTPPHPSAAQ